MRPQSAIIGRSAASTLVDPSTWLQQQQQHGSTMNSSAPSAAVSSSHLGGGGVPALPFEVIERIKAIGCGALVVTSIAVRRINASANTQLEYAATVTVGEKSFTTAAVQAVHDFVSGWTLTFRDLGMVFPIDATYDGRQGLAVSIHSTCHSLQFGSATCRQPREWCALSRPRGEVQAVYHEVYPQGSGGGSGATPANTNRTDRSTGSSSLRMTPLAIRPSSASTLGRAPLLAPRGATGLNSATSLTSLPLTLSSLNNSPIKVGVPAAAAAGAAAASSPYSGGVLPLPSPRSRGNVDMAMTTGGGGGGGEQQVSSPSQQLPTSPSLVPRTVVFSDWLVENIPPVHQRGSASVYLVVQFAHATVRLPSVHTLIAGSPSRDPDGGVGHDDEEEDYPADADEEEVGSQGRHQLLDRYQFRVASWPAAAAAAAASENDKSKAVFEIPLFLHDTTATIGVFWADPNDAAGGTQLLGETTCTIDINSPSAGSKVARRLTFGSDTRRLTVTFTTQTTFHEVRREGTGGRPTSAFPRRSHPGGGATTVTGGGVAATTSMPVTSSSAAAGSGGAPKMLPQQRPPSAGPRRMPAVPSGRGTSSSGTNASNNNTTVVRGYDQTSGLEEEELPADDFVRDDNDSAGEDDDEVFASRYVSGEKISSPPAARRTSGGDGSMKGKRPLPKSPTLSSKGRRSSNGNGAHQVTTSPSKEPTSSSSAAAASTGGEFALEAFVAQFERALQTMIHQSFADVGRRTEALEMKMASVEERVHALLVQEATNDGRGSVSPTPPLPPPPPPFPVQGVSAASSTTGGRPATAPTSTQQQFVSANSSCALSRPSSGDSYCGGYSRSNFPEHAAPLYTDTQLRQTFASYDVEEKGYLNKSQLIHFYRTHNYFAVDDTNDTVEDDLRRFFHSRAVVDLERVTYDMFCLVALRLAKF